MKLTSNQASAAKTYGLIALAAAGVFGVYYGTGGQSLPFKLPFHRELQPFASFMERQLITASQVPT